MTKKYPLQKIKFALGIVVIFFSTFLSTQLSFAAVTPLSVGIVPPVQFPPDDFSVTGIRVSALWGQHRNMYGLDVGLLGNITEQTFVGIGVAGGFNVTKGTTSILGLQLAGLGNINTNKTTAVGLQLALITNYNKAESDVYGVQLSLVNLSEFTNIYGIQAGVYNRAKDVYGIQIGLVNVADSLHGIQIGLANFNGSGPFKISPILNVGF